MSENITLLYKYHEKEIKIPKNYEELKKSFFLLFKEEQNDSFTFKYKDENKDDIIIEEDDKQFRDTISEIIRINAVISVEKIEDLELINDSSENESGNEIRSGIIFKKTDNNISVYELNQKLKDYEKENRDLLEKNKILSNEKEKYMKESEQSIQKNKELVFQKKEYEKKLESLQKMNANEGINNLEVESLKAQFEKEMSQIKIQFTEEQKKCKRLELKLKENEDQAENVKIKEKDILNKDIKINELEQKLEENNENIKRKNERINEYEKRIKNYENEIIGYKSELEKSKLDIINLKKNNERKEKDKYLEEFLEAKYKEKTKDQIDKMKKELNKKIEEESQKLKEIYEKKYIEKENKMREELNQIIEMLMESNISMKSDESISSLVVPSTCQFEHKGIKCQKCFSEPIMGINYKCLECKDYNLCEKCEEKNSKENFHNKEYDFIKLRKTKEIKGEKEKIYSYDCPNNLNLIEYIYEGTEQANIKIILKNNGNEAWPKGKTKLIFDKFSQIKGDEIILESQNIGEEKNYTVILKNLEKMKEGEYKSFLFFNVEGKNFGEKLIIIIKVKKRENKDEEINKYIDKINEFRESYSLSKEEFSNEYLLEVLKKNNFEHDQSFNSLFN